MRKLWVAAALLALAGCNADDGECAKLQAKAGAKRMEATVYEEAQTGAIQLANRMQSHAYAARTDAEELQRKANEVCARPAAF